MEMFADSIGRILPVGFFLEAQTVSQVNFSLRAWMEK